MEALGVLGVLAVALSGYEAIQMSRYRKRLAQVMAKLDQLPEAHTEDELLDRQRRLDAIRREADAIPHRSLVVAGLNRLTGSFWRPSL